MILVSKRTVPDKNIDQYALYISGVRISAILSETMTIGRPWKYHGKIMRT